LVLRVDCGVDLASEVQSSGTFAVLDPTRDEVISFFGLFTAGDPKLAILIASDEVSETPLVSLVSERALFPLLGASSSEDDVSLVFLVTERLKDSIEGLVATDSIKPPSPLNLKKRKMIKKTMKCEIE